MKKRIIIDTWDEEISDAQTLELVLAVVREGKKSEIARNGEMLACYCFGTRFKDENIVVQAELLKSGTNKFCVYKC